ncbi:MAG: hypothetical protein ACRDCF_02125 [Mycoplasmoidaceae bacterium]
MNKKIKLSLLGTLIAGSALAITLPIVSCSSASVHLLTLKYVEGQNLESLEVAATSSLQTLINNANDKMELIKGWTRNSEVPKDLFDSIFNIIYFNDINAIKVPESEAVEKVVFASDIIIEENQNVFEGPTIRIIFNKNYTSTNSIEIKIDKLFLDQLPLNTISLL